MKIGKLMGGAYLKAVDVEDEPLHVIIKNVSVETMTDGRERPVVWFVNEDKGLVLNKINASRITKIAGSDDTDDWKEITITLVHDYTQFQGEDVECIRVKLEKPTPKKAKKVVKEEELDDEVPF